MVNNNRMFQFSKAGRTVVFIQASSKAMARRRTQLVSHLVRIPQGCKVRAVGKDALRGVPIFSDNFLNDMEESIEQAMNEAKYFCCDSDLEELINFDLQS